MFTDLKIPAGRRPMSPTEARISALIGIVFAVMILLAVFEEYSGGRLSILFIVLFWAPMLVLHEMGHAVAARLLGWDVREIVIGFGRDLWQWRFGATRVRIKLAPVEGYVLPAPRDARHVRLKSMLIYAAGPGAELLLLAVLILLFGYDAVFSGSNELGSVALQSLAIVILLGAGFNLLPFSSEGAVSDGLGIISSPFMSDASIELRLLTFELREIRNMLLRGSSAAAITDTKLCLQRFPHNVALQQLLIAALSADGRVDDAREIVREKLAATDADHRLGWLQIQAQVELDADEPSWLVLDLALQEALTHSPGASGLLAAKGASLVLRGQIDDGGNMLAEAWRKNDGSADDSEMLAYLGIAAHRKGERIAADHFLSSFEQVNRSAFLTRRVKALTGRPATN